MKKILLSCLMAVVALAANAERKTLWESEDPAGVEVSWGKVCCDVEGITVHADDKLYITVASTGESEYPQVMIRTYSEDWQWTNVSGVGFAGLTTFPAEQVYTISAADAALINVHGRIMLDGDKCNVTKLEYEEGLAYQDAKELTIESDGFISAEQFNGISDNAKVEFVYSCEGTSGFVGWGAGKLQSVGGETAIDGFPVKAEGENSASYTLADIKDLLNAAPSKNHKAYGLEWVLWGFGDGACTNSRVAVKVYEVVGFEGEGFVANTYTAEPSSYYVAGSLGLCSAEWTVDGDQMTDNGDGTFTYTVSNIAAGTYEFKVTDGAESWYGTADGSNYSFTVSTPCDITITFTESTLSAEIAGDGIGERVFEITELYAPGSFNGWKIDETSKMTDLGDGIYSYTTTVEAGSYTFKFASDDTWLNQWSKKAEIPADETTELEFNSGDCTVTVAEACDLTLTVDASKLDSKTGAGLTLLVTTAASTPSAVTIEDITAIIDKYLNGEDGITIEDITSLIDKYLAQ